MRRLGATLLLAMLALATLHSATSAQEAPRAGAETRLKVQTATRTSVKGQVILSAALSTANGKPLGEKAVEFFQEVELFGQRDAYLGTATTDSSGVALLSYRPAQRGQQTITARFQGDQSARKAEAQSTIEVRENVVTFEEEPLPFAWLRPWLPLGLGAVLGAVWVVLLGVFLNTILAIRAAAAPSRVARLSRVSAAVER